jgi:hypothetical protein
MQILPIPTASFISTLLMNQSLWMKGDLLSSTPRALCIRFWQRFVLSVAAFLNPLFGSNCTARIVLSAVCTDHSWNLNLTAMALENGLSGFWNRSHYLFCATGLGVALLVMLPYVFSSSKFGPIITAAEARTWSEFLPKGNIPFLSTILGSIGSVPVAFGYL